MIGAGAFDRRVAIRRVTESRDPGTNAVVESWTNWLTDVPASVKQSGGREFLEANQIVAERKAVFTVRWVAGLLITDRVAWEGREYDIRDIREIGRRGFLEVHGEAIE